MNTMANPDHPICDVAEGCTRHSRAKSGGPCSAHYNRQLRGGNLTTPVRERSEEGYEKLFGMNVTRSCAEAIRREAAASGKTAHAVAKAVLEAWAKSRS